jgi:hypothetical protein
LLLLLLRLAVVAAVLALLLLVVAGQGVLQPLQLGTTCMARTPGWISGETLKRGG